MTLDELAAMLELHAGHRLHAVDELPAGYCPGLSLTIISDDDGPGHHLPRFNATDPLRVMGMAEYRRWSNRVPVSAPSERHVPRIGREPEGYAPIKPPVTQSLTSNVDWPRFPGEGLNYRGEDPGDEDGHMGGPR